MVDGGDRNDLIVYSTVNDDQINHLTNECYYTKSISYSPDGKYLATGHDNGVVNIRNSKNYKLIQQIKLSEDISNTITLIEIDKDAGEVPSHLVISLSFTPDSNVLIIGTSDSSLIYIDVKYNQIIKEVKLDVSVSSINTLSVSEGGDYVVCSGHKGKAYVFTTKKAKKTYNLYI